MTEKFEFKCDTCFMPTIVEMMQRGGIDLISCKCFDTGSEISFMLSILISFTFPSSIGLETMTFICSRLATDTKGLNCSFISCQFSFLPKTKLRE